MFQNLFAKSVVLILLATSFAQAQVDHERRHRPGPYPQDPYQNYFCAQGPSGQAIIKDLSDNKLVGGYYFSIASGLRRVAQKCSQWYGMYWWL
jgi:hypothetical protein